MSRPGRVARDRALGAALGLAISGAPGWAAGPGFAGIPAPPLEGAARSAAATPAPVPAPDPGLLRVDSHFDRGRAAPGEEVELTVTFDAAPGVTYEPPEIGAELRGLAVLSQESEGPIREAGRERRIKRYKLTADLAGTYEVPAVSLPFTAADGTRGEARTDQILLEVVAPVPAGGAGGAAEVPAAEEGLRDIAPPIPPDPDRRWLLPVAAAIAALGLALLAWAAWRRYRKRRPAPPPPLPHEIALADLDLLLRSQLLATGRGREFAYRLSEVLRRYLEDRFAFPAVESTTEEILRHLPDAVPGLHAGHEDAVRQALQGTDLVKFADQDFGAAALDGWARGASRFVEATVPPPPAEDVAAPGGAGKAA